MQNSKFKIIFRPLTAARHSKRKKRPRQLAEVALIIWLSIKSPLHLVSKIGVKIAKIYLQTLLIHIAKSLSVKE